MPTHNLSVITGPHRIRRLQVSNWNASAFGQNTARRCNRIGESMWDAVAQMPVDPRAEVQLFRND